jgi:hypothetical protein
VSHGEFVGRRFVVAEFATPEDLLEATHKIREKGHAQIDTHTPYPVHGLEEALGIKKIMIPKIVFGAGLAGILAAYSMMYFMNVIDFPINVANRPPHSAPAFVPITFELMVLFGGISAFVGLMALMKLPQPYHPVFEWENFSRMGVDGFFLSVQLPPGDDSDGLLNDVRALGATGADLVVEPER